ncbi:OPT oligopeptide transporter protein-domain-containing protein [Suillus subalutaceus]|uniref:OPT oligopeptide transporter protein-domain-containing protein n=1 Tax=Suillus subalutaceus TaxID=48586 RepID=UPI001B85F396|nr:OPT oligopeptide transporter protein-domain-containing protein [Suillus subalutaceus]KAG1834048.1 OPT oligopeptide transporter protein-domain-containing protein [Suillus subalutaceus]
MSLTAAGAISEHTVPSEKALSTSDNSFHRNSNVDADSGEGVLSDERDIATNVISVDDDDSLNRGQSVHSYWSCLSNLWRSTGGIYYFKPVLSLMFLAVVSTSWASPWRTFIPRRGLLRYLNPVNQFTLSKNAFIVIMASASANSALGTDVLAVQRLYYNITPNAVTSVFLLFSSQLLGYENFCILLYPSKMLYPGVLPLLSMFDALYEGGMASRKKLRVFSMVHICLGAFPEWIFPLLTGVSIFCLAAPNNATVSRLFGGLLSICFDWQYIAGQVNPMTIPLKAQFSNFLGYIFCAVVFVAVYYNNIWKAQNFPFLSQLLYYENGTQYDQTLILNSNYEVDPTLLAEQGLPYYSSTWVVYLLTQNLSLGALFTHLLLWNRSDISSAWTWMNPSGIKNIWANFDWKFWRADGMRKQDVDGEDIDPHYKQMLKYPDAPNSWYFVVFLLSFVVALVVLYKTDSTLPWWGFLISLLLATIFILFLGALAAITGLSFTIQTFGQMIGGYIQKGSPVANMYFVLYGNNTVFQAQLLLRDLKIAQYAKLPPRAAFTAQIIGTLLGAVLNYIMMNSIIDNQREILLSVEGTNIWSGRQPQMYNSQAIAWGGLSDELFSTGQRYQWVPWAYVLGLFVPVPFWVIHRYWPKLHADYLYTPIILFVTGYLVGGINSFILSYFAVAFLSQWWLRTRYPGWFAKYNYIVAAALDGGTQVMVFILAFAVQGASGTSHLFPTWWGAQGGGNYDHCLTLN